MDSAEKVESMDGILMDILIRLPNKSVFRFMCISKRWNNMITYLFFIHHCSRATAAIDRRLLALIEQVDPRRPPRAMNILLIIGHHSLRANRVLKYVPELLGSFINSSNGLILCGRPPSQYHVFNPVSKRWATLPFPSPPMVDGYEDDSVGLMCEENTAELVANYTVVRASAHARNGTVRIETYSSKTRKWVAKILAAGNFRLLTLCIPPVVANGVFHWYSDKQWNLIAVYDPKDDDNHVQLIELPVTHEDEKDFVSHTVTRSPADDTLWYGVITKVSLRFFMLRKGDEENNYKRGESTTIPRSEWILMHCVGVDSLCEDAGLWPAGRVRNILRRTRIIFLEYFIPCNPLVALLRQGSKVFVYNLGSNTIERVQFYGRPRNYGFGVELMCPYLEPPFLSSYCV